MAKPESETLPALKGHFRITAACDARGRTYLARQSVSAPWHLSKPYQDGRALIVQVVNTTAGILAGDDLELRAEAGPGAQLVITSPSASRAFTMRGNGSAGCCQAFTAGEGACLDLCPEPLFPHAGCRYRQEMRVDLHPGASAFLLEMIAPGRAARGELWAWDRLEILNEVRRGGQLILTERLCGSGAELGRLAALHGFPNEAWFATAVIVSPALEADSSPLEKLRALHCPAEGVWAGVSRLPDAGGASWIFKAVAARAPLLRETVRQARAALIPALPLLNVSLRKL